MHKTSVASAIALVALSWTALPAAAQNREHQQMTADLRMLQQQSQELALTLAKLGEALQALNARMDVSDQAAQKRFADQELLMKSLSGDLLTIRERTQDTDTRIRKLSDEIDALRSTVTQLPSLMTPPPPAPVDTSAVDPNAVAPPGGVVPAPAAASTPPPSTVGLSPSRMLETARSDYFGGAYAEAVRGLEGLLKTFPKTEAAAEAQYLLGDTFAAQKRWPEAVAAYTAAIQNHPKSNWIPNSYYGRGKAQEQLGRPDEARLSYEQVIKLYPDTPNAGLAKQALDRLGRPAPGPRPQ